MSKLKKALAKADENRGFDNRRVVGGSDKTNRPCQVEIRAIRKSKIRYQLFKDQGSKN